MNTDLKTKLVFASVLAGVSTMANVIPLKAMPTATSSVPSVCQQVAVSPAALKAMDPKLRQAAIQPEPSQERFYQIKRGPFVESGPEFVQSWNCQMRLP